MAAVDELAEDAIDALIQAGFRRSQRFLYRPACPGCEACVPVRIPVAHFRPGRTLRRVLRRNADLRAKARSPRASPEHYALFIRYLRARHPRGGMDGMGFAEFREMVEDAFNGTLLVEFRDPEGRLFAVSLTDRVESGLSGVYKFFEPDCPRRSLGTLIVLWHVEEARRLGLPYVYLGYWIQGCAKMSYKSRFRPLERLAGGRWVPFDRIEGGRGERIA